MQTNFEMVKEFHACVKQPEDKRALWYLRMKLINEEFEELLSADTPAEQLKEACDLLYVVYGYILSEGWDADEAFKRVHKSNMSKVSPPLYREDGKLLKGPNYLPPELEDLV